MGLLLLSVALVRSAPDDAKWDFRFGNGGLNSAAVAILVDGPDVYVGGTFTAAGSVAASRVARWNGVEWNALGAGLQGPSNLNSRFVVALAKFRDRLYAGGDFTHSAATATPGIAAWDGFTWSPVGTLTGVVYALTVAGDHLYAAGAFQFPGDTNVYAVAKWNGATWDHLNSVLDGNAASSPAARLLAVKSPEIFLAGDFTTLSGQPARYAARWNGSSWESFQIMSNGYPWSMTIHANHLHVSGYFDAIQGVAATNIARWDGANWHPLGAGLNAPSDHLFSHGTGLYAAGSFTGSGGVPLSGIAKWNGASWEAVGGTNAWGRFAATYALALDNFGKLYAVGYIENIAGQPAAHAVLWDGAQWSPLRTSYARGICGGPSLPFAFARGNGGIYAAGVFTSVGGIWATNIARLDRTGWTPLGRGLAGRSSDRVRSLVMRGFDLFAGGNFHFTNAADQVVRWLARWDGADWSTPGSGVNSNVLALANTEAGLIAGGDFTRAGDLDVGRIARWNGGQWQPLGEGFGGSVRALAVSEGVLYAGGVFTNSGATPCSRIARWAEGQWQGLASGLQGTNAQVLALAATNGKVFVGGRFSQAGGVPANNIAVWDGTNWAALGPGVSGTVQAIALGANQVFAGGAFTTAGGLPLVGLARWDGTNWTGLGSGLESVINRPRVNALLYDDGDHSLYVGGLFAFAGGKPASGLARWVERPTLRLHPPEPTPTGFLKFPVTGVAGLRFNLELSDNLRDWSRAGSGQGTTDTFPLFEPPGTEQRFIRLDLVHDSPP